MFELTTLSNGIPALQVGQRFRAEICYDPKSEGPYGPEMRALLERVPVEVIIEIISAEHGCCQFNIFHEGDLVPAKQDRTTMNLMLPRRHSTYWCWEWGMSVFIKILGWAEEKSENSESTVTSLKVRNSLPGATECAACSRALTVIHVGVNPIKFCRVCEP